MKTQKFSIEQFENFLSNGTYSQITGKSFSSVSDYLSYLRGSIGYIGLCASRFFNASLTEIKTWERAVSDNSVFQSLPSKHRSDILSGYHAYITFARLQYGFITINNNK